MTPEESFAEFYAARKDPCLRALVASGTDRGAAEEAVAEAFAPVVRGGGGPVTPGPIDLVGYQVPAFPLTFTEAPDGLTAPSFSLDPSFERVGPGPAHAGWADPADPATGVGIEIRADEPDNAGDDIGQATVAGVEGTLYRRRLTGAGPVVSLVWERDEDQWVQAFGEGRFASPKAVVALARHVVDQPTAVPLQVSLAPRGWEVVAYTDDRIITPADPTGPPATEATARTLNVHLPQPPTAPADLPTATGATGGEMYEVTVHEQPAYLLPTADGWFLQAALPDGTVFVLQTPADFTREQIVEVADGVERP